MPSIPLPHHTSCLFLFSCIDGYLFTFEYWPYSALHLSLLSSTNQQPRYLHSPLSRIVRQNQQKSPPSQYSSGPEFSLLSLQGVIANITSLSSLFNDNSLTPWHRSTALSHSTLSASASLRRERIDIHIHRLAVAFAYLAPWQQQWTTLSLVCLGRCMFLRMDTISRRSRYVCPRSTCRSHDLTPLFIRYRNIFTRQCSCPACLARPLLLIAPVPPPDLHLLLGNRLPSHRPTITQTQTCSKHTHHPCLKRHSTLFPMNLQHRNSALLYLPPR